jgi:hypothetical protein
MTEISIEELSNMSMSELSKLYWNVKSAYTDRLKEFNREIKRIEKENKKKQLPIIEVD